ncbi:MAG: HU family DNA-binding protein [Lachnospiraceae bacterium]|nr:HU family DNA-binding protein [Lachnospiraceae bacterium]
MNKKELVAAVAAKSELSQKDAEKALKAVFDVVTAELVAGQKVAVPGFGTFDVVKKEARTGRNPKTKETIKIAASTAAKFKAAKALKDSLNA